ncbi:MAG: hypothetical protein ISR35_00375 [Planctomycetes bacterium]|nr:hypothetical protein [Planctomycetota bacterium]
MPRTTDVLEKQYSRVLEKQYSRVLEKQYSRVLEKQYSRWHITPRLRSFSDPE